MLAPEIAAKEQGAEEHVTAIGMINGYIDANNEEEPGRHIL
jgi:hypothetical protein